MVKESLILIIITTQHGHVHIQPYRYQSFFIVLIFFFRLIFNVFNSFLIGKIEWFEREWLTQIQIHMNNLYHIQTVEYIFYLFCTCC